MKTGTQITSILLERGTEDMELLAELHKMSAKTGIGSIREFAKKYPRILDLKQRLQDEKESCS